VCVTAYHLRQTGARPISYTPRHLAEKILTSRAALAGERKQVTVLFCDLANNTALAERLGPEAMHTLLNQFFELALGEVHRYEGTINQFLGDGFMALFGAPIAHEDHARRAVLAAVGLRQRLHAGSTPLGQQYGVEVAVRLGLNTGLVIVGAIGDNLRMDYTAVGDTTNVAARLQQVAGPDRIVLSEATHRLIAGYCTTQPLGDLSLKGKARPVRAWEVVAVQETRTRLEVEAERGLTPFVGRGRELQLLTDCFAQAQAGHGQVVFPDVLHAPGPAHPEAPKKTLQLAAVIGREFTHHLLDRLADIQERTKPYLQELKALELIYEKRLYPELAYMFKHALTQDVAYNSLLVQRRQELHRFIGQAIEELYTDRLAEQYEVLAYHFARGEEWSKALEYLLQAAEKATQAFATREAVALYDQALEATGHLGDAVDIETLMAIHQARAHLYFILSDFKRARAEGKRLLIFAQRAGDREREARGLAGMGMASAFGHDFDQGLADTYQAITIAREIDARSVLAGGHYTTSVVHGVMGRLDKAREEINLAITISQSGGDIVHQAFALTFAGQLKNWRGEYTEAVRFESQSLQIACEHALLAPLLRGLYMSALALTGKGDYDEALARFEEGLALSEKVGDEIYHHRLLNTLGWLLIECGDLQRALDLNQRGTVGARKRGDPETIANAELNLADIFLARGDFPLAQECLDGVYRLVHDPATSDWMKWRYSMHLFASLGDFWLARGDPARAQEDADQCLDIATRTHSQKYLVKGWRLRGETARARRQWDEAAGWLQQALTLAQTIGNPTQLWKTHLALGHLHAGARRPEQARQAYQDARAVIEQVKANVQNPELRTSLERSLLAYQLYDPSMFP
jgi:class 3 adenylate cyclase/tetratricopeptide (TPR) repeat protein